MTILGKSSTRTVLAITAIGLSLAFLGTRIAGDPTTGELLSHFPPQVLLIAVIASLPMYWLKASYHASIVHSLDPHTFDRPRVIAVYLQAQLVRYLPGKVWGLVYQSGQMANRHAPSIIITANFVQTLTTNVMAAFLILALAGSVLAHPALLLLLLAGLLAPEWLHRAPGLWATLARTTARWLPALGAAGTPGPAAPIRWSGTAMLASEWFFYFLMFFVLVGDRCPLWAVIFTGTWYACASLLSMFAVVVPAGLAVREALFVASPAQSALSATELVVLAVTLRLLSIVAELLVASAAAVWLRISRK
ncbi:hypothetical protein [Sinimarinibacterium thermocellulolyticum]|uniref:Flippase-like domain-containing protein n=1 Tax=Sinimarinibacterium thermocellulolyticum TaxID=3170016 RepID=A0ABV2AAJ1_9GAMM